MPIPKKIHYCWFGGKKMPPEALRCMESWKKYCPSYELICWNEGNSALNDNLYVRQAYEVGKWAFVSDYVRLKALWEQGGIYLDTDVELLRPLDTFLDSRLFVGFENTKRIATCLIGSEPEHPAISKLLKEYQALTFVRSDGRFDYTTNVERVTSMLQALGLRLDGTRQNLSDIAVYPSSFFSPKDLETGKIHLTEDSYAIHHFQASWMPLRNRVHTRIAQMLGPSLTQHLKHILGR